MSDDVPQTPERPDAGSRPPAGPPARMWWLMTGAVVGLVVIAGLAIALSQTSTEKAAAVSVSTVTVTASPSYSPSPTPTKDPEPCLPQAQVSRLLNDGKREMYAGVQDLKQFDVNGAAKHYENAADDVVAVGDLMAEGWPDFADEAYSSAQHLYNSARALRAFKLGRVTNELDAGTADLKAGMRILKRAQGTAKAC